MWSGESHSLGCTSISTTAQWRHLSDYCADQMRWYIHKLHIYKGTCVKWHSNIINESLLGIQNFKVMKLTTTIQGP